MLQYSFSLMIYILCLQMTDNNYSKQSVHWTIVIIWENNINEKIKTYVMF